MWLKLNLFSGVVLIKNYLIASERVQKEKDTGELREKEFRIGNASEQ